MGSYMKSIHTRLSELAATFAAPGHHLSQLTKRSGRWETCFHSAAGIHLDLTRQRWDIRVREALFSHAEALNVREKFSAMMAGEIVNTSENRPALHTATRDFTTDVYIEGRNITKDLADVYNQIQSFVANVHAGTITGASGKPFTHVLVVGIGGSRLGCDAIYQALAPRYPEKLSLRFLSTVDPVSFLMQTRDMDPESTLVLAISKSYSTQEMLVNLSFVENWLQKKGLQPKDHLVTVTAKNSPGDAGNREVLATFHMFDFIGGRYSVTSAVGALPLALAYGTDVVSAFLSGCQKMDQHARSAAPDENLPLLLALSEYWNGEFLNYQAFIVIPYSAPLFRFPDHIQQLYMESLGKSVTHSGEPLPEKGGLFCFGDIGTDAQHSFFQMLHQSRQAPVEFIGVLEGPSEPLPLYNGVSGHEELWANLLAQADAFASGYQNTTPERQTPGNLPSAIVILENLSAESIGALLALYEARTVYAGFLRNINPFDQYGVEAGKRIATGYRKKMADMRNGVFDATDGEALTRYLLALQKGSFL